MKTLSFVISLLFIINSDNKITTTFLDESGPERLNGRVKQITSYYEIHIGMSATDIASFDEKGNETEVSTKTSLETFSKIRYNNVYDSKGKITETIGIMGTGRNLYKYDADGHLAGMFYYDQNDALKEKFLYKCDSIGNVIQIDRYIDGEHLDFVMKSRFNKDGLQDEFDGFWRSGKLAYKTTYKYMVFDKKYNWVKSVFTEQQYMGAQVSTRIDTLERKITYY